MRSLNEIRTMNGERSPETGHPEITTAWGGGSSIAATRTSESTLTDLRHIEGVAADSVREAYLGGGIDSPGYWLALRLWIAARDALALALRS